MVKRGGRGARFGRGSGTSGIWCGWRTYVKEQNEWVAHRIEGYVPVPVNLTAFWRPTLKNCPRAVKVWRAMVLPKTVPSPHNKIFDVYAFHDPDYKRPWLLATPVKLACQSVHTFYGDRWPVEQIPLCAKQMLGAHRQFVHNPEAVQRLPELALFAGSTLSFLAAAAPPIPTGFWDRHPKATPGRFRRALFGKPFPKDAALPRQLREKKSVTAHLPKGILARRQKTAQNVPTSGPNLS